MHLSLRRLRAAARHRVPSRHRPGPECRGMSVLQVHRATVRVPRRRLLDRSWRALPIRKRFRPGLAGRLQLLQTDRVSLRRASAAVPEWRGRRSSDGLLWAGTVLPERRDQAAVRSAGGHGSADWMLPDCRRTYVHGPAGRRIAAAVRAWRADRSADRVLHGTAGLPDR